MQKKTKQMESQLESYIDQTLLFKKVDVGGGGGGGDAAKIKEERGRIEEKYLEDLQKEVAAENKEYYLQKAREIWKKQDGSKFLEIQLRLLVNSVPELQTMSEFVGCGLKRSMPLAAGVAVAEASGEG